MPELDLRLMPHYHVDDSNHFTLDRSIEFRRLKKNALALINAHRGTVYLGENPCVENMASMNGFRETDLFIGLVKIKRLKATFVCVPARFWRDPTRMANLHQVREQAAVLGHNVVLVPPAVINRQPRLQNALAIQDAYSTHVTGEERLAIFVHLIENGYSTLGDCADAIPGNRSPYTTVLAMVGMGLFEIDLNRPLTSETRIDLPAMAA